MKSQGYLLSPNAKLNTLKTTLQQQLGGVTKRPHSYKCYYLDSLDWRLNHKQLYLQADQLENGIHLQLFNLNSHQLLSQTLCEALPNSITDLPNCRLLTLLKPIIEARSIIPLLKLKLTQHPMEILNKGQKTLAKLNLEIAQLTTPKAPQSPKILWHHTIRSDQENNQHIKHVLSQQSVLTPLKHSLFEQLLSQIKLQPQQRSDEALRALLSYLVEVTESQRKCALQDLDPECLHNIRISSRRSRSLLSALPQTLPKRQQQRLLKGFKKIADITTPLRDLDVILQQFNGYHTLLPLKKRHVLDPARQHVSQQRQQAHSTLCKYLNSYAYRQFITATQRYLQSPLPRRTPLINAQRPVAQLANESIWNAYKKVLKEGRKIDQHSEPETLHTLRKHCKKLRYLLDLFSTLYPENKLKPLTKILKKLQDNLGEYQDLHVHIAHLDNLEQEMNNNQKSNKKLTQAFKQIHAQLEEKQADCRSHFLARFADLNTSHHYHRFEQLCQISKKHRTPSKK